MGDEERRPATQDARGSHKYVSSASAQEWQLSSSRLSQSLLPKLGFANKAANPREKAASIYLRADILSTVGFGRIPTFSFPPGFGFSRCGAATKLVNTSRNKQ